VGGNAGRARRKVVEGVVNSGHNWKIKRRGKEKKALKRTPRSQRKTETRKSSMKTIQGEEAEGKGGASLSRGRLQEKCKDDYSPYMKKSLISWGEGRGGRLSG